MAIAGKAIVPFEGDYSGLISGAAGAAEQAASRFKGALGPVAVVGGTVAALAGTFLALGTNYQKSTDQIAANSDISIAAATRLGNAWLSTGGKVDFTAQQMEDAYAPVAGLLERLNGGILTNAQSTTFLDAAMNLAEATGESLSSTVSNLAGIMAAYGIAVDKAAPTTDMLRNVSAGTGNTLDSLTSTLERMHTKLGPLSPDLADTSTLLLDLAANGVTGSRGLLAVSTGMTTLLGTSKNAVGEAKILGLNLYTANGQFVGMQSVIEQLAPKLDKMTEKQRLAAEAALFGGASAKTLDATLLAGLPGWDSAAKAADKTGTAQDGAKKATSGLSGELDLLKTKVIDGATSLGDSLIPKATQFTGWILDDGIPDVEKFGNWVGTYIINPFMHVAEVVVPDLITALGFVLTHLGDFAPVLIPLGAALASVWAVNKVTGYASAIQGVIGKLAVLAGAQASASAQNAAAQAAQDATGMRVFVTNWAMIGGGGGALAGGEDELSGMGKDAAPFAGGAAPEMSPALLIAAPAALIASSLYNTYTSTVPLQNAAKNASSEMAALAQTVGITGKLTMAQAQEWLKDWQAGDHNAASLAANLDPVVNASESLAQAYKNGVISADGMVQAQEFLTAQINTNGPLTAAQSQAFRDAVTHGVTDAWDLNATIEDINIKLAPAVPYAQALAAAFKAGLTGIAAVTTARGAAGGGGFTRAGGGPITETVVGVGMSTGLPWTFHKDETVIPNAQLARSGNAQNAARGPVTITHVWQIKSNDPVGVRNEIQRIIDQNFSDFADGVDNG